MVIKKVNENPLPMGEGSVSINFISNGYIKILIQESNI
jgi:hypothetical protein